MADPDEPVTMSRLRLAVLLLQQYDKGMLNALGCVLTALDGAETVEAVREKVIALAAQAQRHADTRPELPDA